MRNFHIQALDSAYNTDGYLLHPFKVAVYAFSYLTEGEVLVDVDGQNMLVSAGQIILVPENHPILIRHFKDCKGVFGYFTLDFLKDASYPVLRSDTPIAQSFWFDDAVFIGALMQRMITAYEDRDKAFMQSGMDLILGQLRLKGSMAAVPEKFLQLVFDREKPPLSVSEYADMLSVTPNYLNKTVKLHTHRTAIDWIEIARLNMAKQLLKDPSVPIVEVASRVGLDDQSYFSRFFKKRTGITPSQYRNGK